MKELSSFKCKHLGIQIEKFLLLLMLLFTKEVVHSKTVFLHQNWQFSEVNNNKWLPAKVPGTIHTDLMQNKIIADPFYRDNELKLAWIADKDWEYKTSFDVQEHFDSYDKIQLQFEGLDTYTDIFLNEHLLRQTDNMFRVYTMDVKKYLRPGNNNLRIVFRSAKRITDELAQQSLLIRPCENNRHYARKAQYNFGWDWAPKLITCGIWRPVKLIYGDVDPMPISRYSQVKLVQEKDSIGQSFYFAVNGKPTFMKGANWIPADVFLPRITRQRYRNLLIAAKEANFNMLRVWGGGIYEDDYFYSLCDSLGIYVWQDFMFAGAMYPADSHFVENVKQEAIDNILRLRKHKCIVLWCGNNEIDEAWHNWGWQKQFDISEKDSMKLWSDYLQIFNELLPSLIKEYDPGRQYITSSPLYGWGRRQSMTHGDSHYWGMWWGLDSIQKMQQKVPRFMSEYGMQSMPSLLSVNEFALPSEMDTSSAVIKLHQKHPSGFKTLAKYLTMEKITSHSFQSFIIATQELQSRALQISIQSQLYSNGRCMGSLLWQFNDCWPVCSWSIVDYYGRKKKAYYTVKQLYH